MPIKRGKRWQARVTDPTTGRRHFPGTYPTKKEAREAEDQYRARHFPRMVTGRETVDSFADRWLRDYPRSRESTNRTYAGPVARFGEHFAGRPLTSIDRPTARKWAMEHKHHDLHVVRAMFTDALNDGLVEHNPFTNLRLPGSQGRKNITALTEKDLVALADRALDADWGDFGREVRAMILFAGYVGTRPGETYALRRDDIAGDEVMVARSREHRTGKVGPTKNGLTRYVIVPPPALAAIEDVTVKPNGLLFTNSEGGMWQQSSFYRYWNTVRALAGRPGLDFHEMRHCAATMLLERGVSVWDVSIQLGHTDGGVLVRERYGHPSHANARARMLAAYGVEQDGGADVTPLRRKAAGE